MSKKPRPKTVPTRQNSLTHTINRIYMRFVHSIAIALISLVILWLGEFFKPYESFLNDASYILVTLASQGGAL